ncbi:serine hydrolase [Actinorhabdospora filicis]|uniref:Serine hydrolase n=1 Tax=Actinorhabdospora filicis TaxID=1785913 RepID=A0A9W6W9G0_9ACTN|nr:serine hydrolase [Actinorhabdospora filicis]
MRRAAATVLAATTLLAVAAVPEAAHAGRSRPDLRETVQSVVDRGFAGVQMRVYDERGEWTGSAGVSRLGSPARPSTEGLFRVGSATKAFTSALVLGLVDEGRVGLDTSAGTYLPEWHLDPRITVRMLLQHTSGVFNFTGEYYPDGTFTPGIPVRGKEWVDNRFHDYRPAELVTLALSKEPRFAPGQGWSYSNTNYVLLRLLVENVTGDPFARAMRQRVLRPLGLSDTSVPDGRTDIPGPHAHGYHRYLDGEQWKTADVSRQSPTWLSTGGDMISTTEDLSAFLAALLDAEFFSQPLLDEMLRPDPRSPVGYGLGLSVNDMGLGCGTLVNINGYAAVTYSTLDGRRSFSASITEGDAPIDFITEGGKAVSDLAKSVFCKP